ncbi:hypothetical protein CsatA_007004 [Cannabis sativa]
MIKWEDVYKVVEATAPLYVALILGYGSVKWWKIFTPDQCGAINRFVCFFTLPLYTFDFTAHVDPFKWNYRFIAADAISKSSVVQAIFWMTLLLIVLECYRTAGIDISSNDKKISVVCGLKDNGVAAATTKDLEINAVEESVGDKSSSSDTPQSYWSLIKVVGFKVAMNPNSYAVFIGLIWAIIASRCHIKMPSIIEGSISIMSKAGAGTAMFSMGIFMALQKKIIACGLRLTVFGMVLRFIAGPAAMAIGCIAAGLHGDILRVAIVQSALPQAIASFIFAKEYGLHAEVLSTAVIFGTMVSVPVLIAFYIGLDVLHLHFL